MDILRIVKRIARPIIAAGLVSLLSIASPAMADTIEDYLVQQVCDNGSGGHTSADPITCPSTARKLRIGETLPYHKWDGTSASTALQISDSFPIKDLFGRTRVVQNVYFDSQTAYTPPYFETSRPNPWRSGYDMMIADGNYVSAAATYDPGRGWQPLWSNSGCSLSDSWLYAPKSATVPFSQNNTTSNLTNSAPQCPTVTNFVSGYTVWNYYPAYTFESGKVLGTIASWHFAGTSVNSNAFELFYFTKEYGKTRWEAWASGKPIDSDALTRCPHGTNNGELVFGTTTYHLQRCSDFSNIVPVPNGDWDPAANWHVDPLYNSLNMLKNTHMQCTDGSGKAKDCNNGGACQTISPWNRYGNLNWGYDSALQGSSATANCALQISFPGPWNGESVYQDQYINTNYTNYSFGSALWLPYGGTATAYVVLFELNSAGGVVAQDNVGPVTVGQSPKFFEGTFARNPSTTQIRFQIYPQSPNVIYEFTESWVAPVP